MICSYINVHVFRVGPKPVAEELRLLMITPLCSVWVQAPCKVHVSQVLHAGVPGFFSPEIFQFFAPIY